MTLHVQGVSSVCEREGTMSKYWSQGARFEFVASGSVSTRELVLRIHGTHGAPAAVFRVRGFG
jgi:hypothetical protein